MSMRLAHIFRSVIGAQAQEHRLNVLSNNLANINTPGFKRDVPIFNDFMVQATKTDLSQGHLKDTGGKLDLALNGPGFFQIETPGGIRYSRNGAFTLSGEGVLVNKDGYPIRGDLTFPEKTKEITINEDGEVFADGQSIGTIELVEFDDPSILAKEGHSLFKTRSPEESGRDAVKTSVEQGYLEMSNVNIINSTINMIDTVRTYEAFQKMIHTFEETDSKVINEVGHLI